MIADHLLEAAARISSTPALPGLFYQLAEKRVLHSPAVMELTFPSLEETGIVTFLMQHLPRLIAPGIELGFKLNLNFIAIESIETCPGDAGRGVVLREIARLTQIFHVGGVEGDRRTLLMPAAIMKTKT